MLNIKQKTHMTVENLKQIEDIYIKFYQTIKSKHIWKQLRSYHIAYGPVDVSQTIVKL